MSRMWFTILYMSLRQSNSYKVSVHVTVPRTAHNAPKQGERTLHSTGSEVFPCRHATKAPRATLLPRARKAPYRRRANESHLDSHVQSLRLHGALLLGVEAQRERCSRGWAAAGAALRCSLEGVWGAALEDTLGSVRRGVIGSPFGAL